MIWAELGKVRDQMQDVSKLLALCETIRQAQQSHEKQLGTLRRFAKQVECEQGVPPAYVPGASASSSAMTSTPIQTPVPPSVSPPPIPTSKDQSSSQTQVSLSFPQTQQPSKPHCSTVVSQVRAGAIRMDITNPEEWAEGDVAVIRNQEAKKVRDIGSLIFETPIQHDYEEGVEVRSLLSSEQLEEIDGRLAVVDVSPTTGERFVKFWVDAIPIQDGAIGGNRASPLREQRRMETPTHQPTGPERSRESPDFGGGVDYYDRDAPRRERLPDSNQESPPRIRLNQTPPEDQNPKGCSLHSMEPLRDWFCKAADMTSAAEFEAALRQLEDDPPDIREYNANIREERWTHFSLDGVRFPAMTVDAIQRGEALAIFERDLIIHFQQISRAAALYIRGNKKVNFVFQQQSSTIPLMNPSPTEIVELFSFVESTLIQYATIAGHFPSANASSVKPCKGSPCLWTVVPIRPGEDPSVKTSEEELTRGVVITYVDNLLFTGFQCHINALTKALLAKYVMKQSGILPVEIPGMEKLEGIDFLGGADY